MLLRFRWCLLLAILCLGHAQAEVRLHECRGKHGERVFSDRQDCGADLVRSWSLPLPSSSPSHAPDEPAGPRQPRARRSSSRSIAADRPDSYRCIAGRKTWYQHRPCRGSGARGESVKQERIPRLQACREIARPAALLRRGYQQDERAGPYEKATGRDPCR